MKHATVNYESDEASLLPEVGRKARPTIKRPICQHCLRSLVADTVYIDKDEPLVLWKALHVNVTMAEWRVMAMLVNNAPNSVRYQDLYDAVRGRLPGQAPFHCGDPEQNVRSAIKRLRQKFKAIDSNFDCIRNFQAFGYRWVED